jgi:hypothetical protein
LFLTVSHICSVKRGKVNKIKKNLRNKHNKVTRKPLNIPSNYRKKFNTNNVSQGKMLEKPEVDASIIDHATNKIEVQESLQKQVLK